MPKKSSVIFFSSKAISGGATNDCKFYIDWNAILKPNMPYYVSFSMLSSGTATYDGHSPPLLWIDFYANTYSGTSSGGAGTNNVLGIIKPLLERPVVNSVILYADEYSNSPSYIANRPNNTIVNIKIVRTDGTLWQDDAATPINPQPWTITLHFTEAIEQPIIKKMFLTSNVSTATYAVDMNAILDKTKQYKVSFTLAGGKPVGTSYGIMMLNTNWNLDTTYPFSTYSYASEYGILGVIGRRRYDTGSVGSYIDSDINTNEPVTIVHWGNTLELRFVDDTLALHPNFPGSGNKWALMLSFTEIK